MVLLLREKSSEYMHISFQFPFALTHTIYAPSVNLIKMRRGENVSLKQVIHVLNVSEMFA